ncbi:DNA polymerase III, delta subunit [Desulfosporosinus acidiphilus SJ4]|uniref:DNA polymerase III subunit delta n=1 Tax=Desulfosporosinus acidiphilus (strain DSM 22704 / JCM 16185 / SJ4) TaxID=646529 RepID=I4DAT5_DESAJ|nr:DNA polymerase III subunit delta [Desulfosporosinus acidiphilus]AFM42909.1 DNA polymerase III, delta subunit [Desulfosporosinus acidiphilus SJ4]
MKEIEIVKGSTAKGKIPPVYLWYGEDRFFIQEAYSVLKSFYLQTDPSGSGIERVSAKNVSPADICELANSMSFFANRLVVVEEVTYFQDGQTADLDPFLEYLANPNPSTCLLFLAENVHKGRKFYKALDRAGEILEFRSPKRPQEWIEWLQEEVKHRGKTMSRQAMAQFIEWAGHNTGVLSQELNKLVIYTGDRKTITEEDFKAVTTQTVEASVFQLLDAVAKRSAKDAVTSLHEVLRKEHPLKVLTLLIRQVRLLLGCNALRERGRNVSEAPSALGISPFEAQKLWQQSLHLSTEKLTRGLQECLRTDLALKTSGGDPDLLLEIMIVKFCE